jgi:hypothetical protein
MPTFGKKFSYGLSKSDTNNESRKMNIVGNPVGNAPIPDHPFIFSPNQTSEVPIERSMLPVVQRQPMNTLKAKVGGSIDANLFNIDFNKRKNRKKVILNLE